MLPGATYRSRYILFEQTDKIDYYLSERGLNDPKKAYLIHEVDRTGVTRQGKVRRTREEVSTQRKVTEVTKNVYRHPYRFQISSLHQSRELSFAEKNSSDAIIQS